MEGGGCAGSCVEAIFMGTRPTHTELVPRMCTPHLATYLRWAGGGFLPFPALPLLMTRSLLVSMVSHYTCGRVFVDGQRAPQERVPFDESLERKRFSGSPKVEPKGCQFLLFGPKICGIQKEGAVFLGPAEAPFLDEVFMMIDVEILF